MMLSAGVHVLRFALMAVVVLVIVGGGVYFGFFKATHERSSSPTGPTRPAESDEPHRGNRDA
ncbi:hypothetical protein ACVW00_002828 [Marmoricola sp. URHA0025 HA25]